MSLIKWCAYSGWSLSQYDVIRNSNQRKTQPTLQFCNLLSLSLNSVPVTPQTDAQNQGTEPQITPVDDWKVTIDSQNVTLPQTGPDGPSSGQPRPPIDPG